MANTYSQMYVQIVFAVKDRLPLIKKEFKEDIHRYITGIVKNKNQKIISINSMPDHIHIFIGIKPNICLSDLVRDIKNNSSRFINKSRWIKGKFKWQEGFGAFTYGQSQIDSVDNYIKNQERHHTRKSSQEEYVQLLEKFCVDYEKKYIC